MVSAVFHSPLDARDALHASQVAATPSASPAMTSATTAAPSSAVPTPAAPSKPPVDWMGLAFKLLSPVAGLALLPACRAAIVDALTDEADTGAALHEVLRAVIGDA